MDNLQTLFKLNCKAFSPANIDKIKLLLGSDSYGIKNRIKARDEQYFFCFIPSSHGVKLEF